MTRVLTIKVPELSWTVPELINSFALPVELVMASVPPAIVTKSVPLHDGSPTARLVSRWWVPPLIVSLLVPVDPDAPTSTEEARHVPPAMVICDLPDPFI